MQPKKTQIIAPKKSDAKKNKLQEEANSKPIKKTSDRKKLNEFGENDAL